MHHPHTVSCVACFRCDLGSLGFTGFAFGIGHGGAVVVISQVDGGPVRLVYRVHPRDPVQVEHKVQSRAKVRYLKPWWLFVAAFVDLKVEHSCQGRCPRITVTLAEIEKVQR